MIDVIRLTTSLNKKILLNEFSHSFTAGSVYAVTGNNGVGKTTLLKTLAGLRKIPPQCVFVHGIDLCTMDARLRACTLSYLAQSSPEHPYCTAQSRIAQGLMPIFGFNFNPDENSLRLIRNLAIKLNIHHLLAKRLSHLSGGEQRLVHLAKCLINPHIKILLLDEPSAFLDLSQQERLGHLLKDLKSQNKLVIFTSHDSLFIQKCADTIITIEHYNNPQNSGHLLFEHIMTRS